MIDERDILNQGMTVKLFGVINPQYIAKTSILEYILNYLIRLLNTQLIIK